ncbi:MAG: hypothetical protein Kow0073_04190 [Immundisolibacter sp.]
MELAFGERLAMTPPAPIRQDVGGEATVCLLMPGGFIFGDGDIVNTDTLQRKRAGAVAVEPRLQRLPRAGGRCVASRARSLPPARPAQASCRPVLGGASTCTIQAGTAALRPPLPGTLQAAPLFAGVSSLATMSRSIPKPDASTSWPQMSAE